MTTPPPSRQFGLDLRRDSPPATRPFMSSDSNADAVARLTAWPHWPGGVLALVGPAGCGKTHLARRWAVEFGATQPLADLAALRGRPVLLEDADRLAADERLFHLINLAAEPGGGLLLTARKPPLEWPTDLPDLRSRLNALPVALIAQPDDAVLEAVLRAAFAERAITPAPEIYPYLLTRIERSAPAAIDLVERLNAAALAKGAPVSRALARQFFEISPYTGDLFDAVLAAPMDASDKAEP